MLRQCDNKGAVDLVNGHSIGGTQNISTCEFYILEITRIKDWLRLSGSQLTATKLMWGQRKVDRQVLTSIHSDLWDAMIIIAIHRARETNGMEKIQTPLPEYWHVVSGFLL